MNTLKCPSCGSQGAVFKQKAQQWECGDCELRFEDTQNDARPQHIFLSYPHAPDKHSQLVEDVARVIEAKGHIPWFDRNKIKAGYNWRESITKGVLESDWMIIFMSQKSLAVGGVCLEEVGIALQKSGHETLLTVLLEDEKTVNPPISLTHVQWLDIKDFEQAYPKDRSNPDDIYKWEQWLDEKFSRLIAHIENKGDITGEITFLRDRLQPSSFVGQIAHSINGFVGRQWVFDEIQNWQKNQRETRTFVIEGAAGIGKSAIAGQLSQQLRDVIGIYFCNHNDASTRDANNLVRTMAFQIASRDPAYRSWLQNKLIAPQFDGDKLLAINASELFRELFVNAPLINEEHKTRLILVIDGLDEAKDETGKNAILELVRDEFRKLPLNIGVVITTRPEQDISSHFALPFILSNDDKRNIDDITEYLNDPLDSIGIFDENPSGKVYVVEMSGGVMLYASELARSIKAKQLDPLEDELFPEGLSGIYHGYMRREFKSAEVFHQTSAVLAELIAVSPLPLSEALMRAITSLTKVEFARYIKPLSSLLVIGKCDIRASGEVLTYSFFTKSFADWLLKPKRLHDYRLEGDGLKRIGDFLFANSSRFFEEQLRYTYGSDGNAEIRWGIDKLLPVCLPKMALWEDVNALDVLGGKLHERGWHRGASVAFSKVLEVTKKNLGKTHPNTIISMANLATSLFEERRWADSQELYEQVLAARKAILGDTHRDTLRAMDKLASTLYERGNFTNASALREKVLAAHKTIFGDSHPQTLYSMLNLALSLCAQGDLTGGIVLFEQVLAAQKSNRDAYSITLLRMQDWATEFHYNRNWVCARALFEQILSAQKSNGNYEEDTLRRMGSLANTLYKQGDLKNARELYELILPAKKAIGHYTEKTILDILPLVGALYQKGELVGARSLYKLALTLNKETFGKTPADTLISLNNLAEIFMSNGELTRSSELYEQMLTACKATFGNTHPNTLYSMNNLATFLHNQGDLANARELYEQVLAARKSILGDTHTDTLSSMHNLATTLYNQGDLTGARELYEQMLAAYKETLIYNHPDTLLAMHDLALTMRNLGELNEARELCRSAYEGRVEQLGSNHSDTLWTKRALATILFKQEQYEEARAIQEETMSAQKAHIGESDSTTLVTMGELADTYEALGRIEDAKALRDTHQRLINSQE